MDDKNQNPAQQASNVKPVSSGQKTIQPSESLLHELDADKTKVANTYQSTEQPKNVAPPNQATNISQPTEDLTGLTGSQLQPEKQPPINLKGMPIGIYLLIGLLLVGFILGFFNNNTSTLESLSLLVNLGLAIGLIFRKEAVRKTMVVFSGLLTVLYILIVVGLVAVRLEANSKFQQAQTDLAQLSSLNRLTPTQTAEVNDFKAAIAKQEKILNKRYSVAYAEYAVVISANVILIIYLNLPKVKAAFS